MAKKKKFDLENGLKLTAGGTEPDGGTVWTSEIEQDYFLEETGMTVEQLARRGRLVAADGTACPQPPDTLRDRKSISEYYQKWVKEQLRHGGVMLYEKQKSALPIKIRFDKKNGVFERGSKPEKPEQLKKPGFWNRRRDKKLLAAGQPGTPEMEAYREKLAMQKTAEDRRVKFAKIEKVKEQARENLRVYAGLSEKELTPELKEMAVVNISTIMACDSLDDLGKKDPAYANRLASDIIDAADSGDKEPRLFGSKETRFVRAHIDRIKNPADLNKYLTDDGVKPLREEYVIQNTMQKKALRSPFVKYEKVEKTEVVNGEEIKYEDVAVKVTNPAWEQRTIEGYARFCSKSLEALNRLKDLGAAGGAIPEFLIPQVKRDLAFVALQKTIDTAVRTDKSDMAAQIVNKLSDDEPFKDDKGVVKSNLDRALDHFQDKYVDPLKVEEMDGKDIALFLAQNKENGIVKDFIKAASKPVYVLADNAFGPAAKQAAPADKVKEEKGPEEPEHDVPVEVPN